MIVSVVGFLSELLKVNIVEYCCVFRHYIYVIKLASHHFCVMLCPRCNDNNHSFKDVIK